MKVRNATALSTLMLAAWLGLGGIDAEHLGVAPAAAAGGCGVGFHRGPYGYCRPNYYGGYYGEPGYYRGGVVYGGRTVYGYRRGFYGGRVYGGRVYGGRVYRAGGFHAGRVGGFRGGRFRR